MNFGFPIVVLKDFFCNERLNFIINFFFSKGAEIYGKKLKRIYMVTSANMVYDTIIDEDGTQKEIPTWQYYPKKDL